MYEDLLEKFFITHMQKDEQEAEALAEALTEFLDAAEVAIVSPGMYHYLG